MGFLQLRLTPRILFWHWRWKDIDKEAAIIEVGVHNEDKTREVSVLVTWAKNKKAAAERRLSMSSFLTVRPHLDFCIAEDK